MQIFGHAVARNRHIKIRCARKIAAALRVQSTVSRQSARDLADAIGAEVEADAGVIIANRCQRLAIPIRAHERNDKLVGDIFVVGILHSLHRVCALAALRIGENHGVIGLRNALPAPVTIHGVVAAVNGCDLPAAVLAHLLLQLLQITRAVGRQRVAAVHEGVNRNTIETLLLRHSEQRVKMGLLRVHPAIRD